MMKTTSMKRAEKSIWLTYHETELTIICKMHEYKNHFQLQIPLNLEFSCCFFYTDSSSHSCSRTSTPLKQQITWERFHNYYRNHQKRKIQKLFAKGVKIHAGLGVSVSPVVIPNLVIEFLFELRVFLKVFICGHRADFFLYKAWKDTKTWYASTNKQWILTKCRLKIKNQDDHIYLHLLDLGNFLLQTLRLLQWFLLCFFEFHQLL